MKITADSRFAKLILYLIMLSIGLSLVVSYSCGGPVDQIFIGWRDSTICPEPAACLVGGHMEITPFTMPLVVISFLLMIIAVNFALSLMSKVWKRYH